MNADEEIQKLIDERDVWTLAKLFFNFNLTPKQEKIVRVIAFSEHPRVAINCMTRYGKTRCVIIGVGLYILFNENKKIYLISASDGQAAILRNYLSEILVTSPYLQAILDESTSSKNKRGERLKRELSRKRITFKNGCELNTISAQGEADRLMGHGGDLIIEDEASLIKDTVYTGKISRMLGDSPDSILIEIANPWNNVGHYYDHWHSPRFYKIHVGWKEALKEGRITKEFLEEQREMLHPLEFQVLYESEFPEQSEDSLYNHLAVKECMEQELDIEAKDVIIACDVADKGVDETVIFKAVTDGTRYKVVDVYWEPVSEQTRLATRILDMQQAEPIATRIHIDDAGMGVGVLSMVRQALLDRSTCTVQGCGFGRRPSRRNMFMNKKGEEYFRNAQIIKQRLIQLPKEQKLMKDLMGITWEKMIGNNKIRVNDPENKSPDWSDTLVYLTWAKVDMAF